MKALLILQISQIKKEIADCSNFAKMVGLKEKLTELQIKLEFIETRGEGAIIPKSKNFGVALGEYSYSMEEECKELKTGGAGQFSIKRLRYNIEKVLNEMIGKTGAEKLNLITSYKENAGLYNNIVGFNCWDLNYRP